MIKKIFSDFPSIVATMVCPDCTNRFLREEIIVTVNLPTDDFTFLEDIMENYNLSLSYCKNCDTSMTQALEIKEHIVGIFLYYRFTNGLASCLQHISLAVYN